MPSSKLKTFLDGQRIKYETIQHSIAYTSQEVAARMHVHGWELAKTTILKVDGKPTEEARILAGLKTVMYHSHELDITASIVALLNKNWDEKKARLGKAGTQGAPKPVGPSTAAPGPGEGKK